MVVLPVAGFLYLRCEPLELTHSKPLASSSFIISLGVIGILLSLRSISIIYVKYVFVNINIRVLRNINSKGAITTKKRPQCANTESVSIDQLAHKSDTIDPTIVLYHLAGRIANPKGDTMKKKQPNTRHGRAAIYARYSSHNQREASIEQQVKACRELAVRLGLDVVETYEDKAISGKSDRRPSFQRLLRDAEKGYFDCVLAWKSNRMGRNMLQAMTNEARLKDWGVRTFYAEEDFDDTAAGRFALRNMMNVNQFYSENMAEDITRGMMDNASKCLSNGALPLGYKAGENGRIVLDKAQAAVVQEIYTRVACGEPFVDIAADLNRGIK